MISGVKDYAIAGLSAALILSLAWGLRVDHLRAKHKEAHSLTIERYKNAQETAQRKFDAQIAALQAHNRKLNDEADRKASDIAIVYRDRVISLPAAPAQCSAGSTSVPSDGVSESADRSSAEAVILTRSDAMICAINQSRLESAHDWAVGQ